MEEGNFESDKKFDSNQQYREYFRKELIPHYYRPAMHVLFNFGVLICLALYYIFSIHNLTWLEFLIFPLSLLFGTFAVYIIHRYLLHIRRSFYVYGYEVHSKMHHRFYTYDHIVYDKPLDFYILFFPPTVVLAHLIVFGPWTAKLLVHFMNPNAVYLFFFGSTLYFLLYEIFHYASHLPEDHWVLKLKFLAFMREHHRLHHDPKIMHDKNFDIVIPLFDYLVKTMVRKRP